MHEYSIVSALMERVESEARERNAACVRRVRVRIGELSGVDPELLASAYEVFRERTLCEDAELAIERVAARWVCERCGRVTARGGILGCVICGGASRLTQGDEIVLQQIEMEVP